MLSVNPASSGSSASSATDNSNIAAFVSQNTIGILAVVPGSPTSVVATSGNTQLAVTWVAPVSDGGSAIAKYVVKYSSNGGARGSWTQFVPSPRMLITASSCIVTDLTNGTTYVVKVIADNAVGISLPSVNSAPATPAATVPDSPTSVVATSGNAQLAVTWTAPASTGGSAITEYLVKYSINNGSTWTRWGKSTLITATSCTVTGLTNGTPSVIKVIAKNAIGISPPSANSGPATPLGTALTPTFGATTATADGFTVQITNHDSSYSWAGTATASGTVAISGTGFVTVTGVAPGTSSTATITTTRAGYTGGTADVAAMSVVGTALTPTFGTQTATSDGFTVVISNYDSNYTWAGTATASGSVAINSSTGLATITGVAPGTSSTATITTTRSGYTGGTAHVSQTSVVGAALNPTFGTPTATADGFTVVITNYDSSYTWAGTATASGSVAIDSIGFVTVTGVAPGTSSTATITTTRAGYTGGTADVAAMSVVGTALTPTFGTTTATADGFTVQISNYDSSYTWAGTATAPGISISGSGLVTVTGVAANTSSTATITTTKPNTVGGTAPVTATSLAAALTPTFGTTTATVDGFTVVITNYNVAYTWAGSATASGSVAIDSTGFVTVTGVATGTSSTATITTTRVGYAVGTAPVTATSLAAALTPTFGATTATADGFTVQITNHDSSYSWAGTATASGTVAISGTGFVTVTGVAPGTSSTATITTTKSNTVGGSATVAATSLLAMSMVTVGNPGNAADTNYGSLYGAVSYSYQIGKYDVTGSQYTVFLNAVGSTDTYALYNVSMGTDINVAQISQSGSSGSYTYAVLNSTGSRPISYVSWFDCARFSNWMANGQPSGAQSSTTTENGAYNMNGATTGNAVAANTTNPNTSSPPTFRIPLENEWYKAAYYSPYYNGPVVGGYYAYATRSDTAPGTTMGSSFNQANYKSAFDHSTDVGAFSDSGSFYGTFDQSGNVYQWNDLDGTAGSLRGVRGGYWYSNAPGVSSLNRITSDPSFESYGDTGFRLASPAAALNPTFGATTATADGFTVPITNFDSSYTWAGTATASGSVAIDSTGLVTVTGVAALTSSTATITTAKSNTVGGTADVTATSLAAALTPTFGATTATADGFTVPITNYDSSYTWAGTATASGTVVVTDTGSGTGLATITGVAVNTSSTATITTTQTGYAGGSNTVAATSLNTALTPAFGTTTATADGFTVVITNYDSSYTWAGTATASGTVAISGTGLVTVTGVAANTLSTATITTAQTGYVGGSNTVAATSLAAALTPTFGSTTATTNGFTVQITNYNSSYTWAGNATASGSVSISGTGLVTVSGVAAETSSTATITTTKSNTVGGSATVTRKSLMAMSMVTVGNPGNTAGTTSYGAVSYSYQIGAYDVTGSQYTAFLNAVGSTDTYALYNASMGTNSNVAQISRSGTSGTYTYAVKNGTGSRPISYVSWFDSARFSNWMANGQPRGAQTSTTTENGAYNLNGATTGNAKAVNATNPNTSSAPTYRIPLENEWYKAAYYDPTLNSGTGGYWTYATQSNSAPGTTIGSSANQANYNNAFERSTDVGSFSGSGSFYGTFDQSGNVFQWNDLDGTAGSYRGLRGGDWNVNSYYVSSSSRSNNDPPSVGSDLIGFRLAGPV